ncbi:MAG: (Fe-S)-binding protein [Tissierellia bacterium]|nr:(Fe-S)-binding protein [Tissierellia bacterium]
MTVDVSKCIDCGKCTRNCLFLDKYDLNLKKYKDRPDLAYHCYLCGECRRVCPVDIDGRKLSLELRTHQQEMGYEPKSDGFGMVIFEKKDYLFKNYRGANSKTAFFPGCNFPAYYPQTTRRLSGILQGEFGISTVFDCCGKPMADLALKEESTRIFQRLGDRLRQLGIEELLLACPNCYYHFKGQLEIQTSMIYEKEEIMERLIQPKSAQEIKGRLFLPCPDKDSRRIYKMLKDYLDVKELPEIKKIQCCGAGGCASVKERELAKEMRDGFQEYDEEIYLYCATCSGMITKSNPNVKHLLPKLMGMEEQISTGIQSLLNRAVFSLKGTK